MKKNYLHQQCWCLIFILFLFFKVNAQTTGDLAFVGFNADGDDDFSIVALNNITANSTIYIKDSGAGRITWDTGVSIITAGTIITFTDTDSSSNPFLGVSIGSITKSGSLNWSASGEAIFVYLGTDKDTPTVYITGIKNGTITTELTGTGLTIGTNFLEINNTSSSPDGGAYTGSRNTKATYSEYLAELVNETNWSSSTTGENFVPFSGELFSLSGTTINTWTGASSSVWNLAGNWSNGIPTSTTIVTIPKVATSPIISSGTTALAGNLTIESGEILTINSDNSLTVSGLLTITGDLTINAGGSLILNGTSTGNLTYNVSVNDTNWHLISSPVAGEQYDDAWNTANSINVSGAGLNDAVSTYNNNTSTNGVWEYFQTGNPSTAFNQGQGYSLKRTSAGNYGFIGTFPTSNVQLTITQGFGAVNKWNFIGNPFPSYIKVSELIAANTANLTDVREFVYVWNGANYAVLAGTDYIHPGQGFFVNADNSTANNFTIAKSLQSHQTGITFYKTASDPTIKVFVNDQDNNQKFTEIRYVENTTKSLDPGFDAGTFTGQSTSFSLFSHLVSNSNGVDFMLQSLPKDDYENTIIPLGLNADTGKEIIFSINHQNLPSGLMVFIEDTEMKTITRLDESSSNYKITLDANSNGIGRFFLRTSTTDIGKTLDVDDLNLEQVNMFLSSDRNLRIAGLRSDKATLTIYNILGKKVYHESLTSNITIDVTLSNALKQGIYIVKLETDKRTINKKIFLK